MDRGLTIKVPELQSFRICFETVSGGLIHSKFYVAYNDADWESVYGKLGYYEADGLFFSGWKKLVFDGLWYIQSVTDEEMLTKINKDELKRHEERMRAIEILMMRPPLPEPEYVSVGDQDV